MIEKGGYLQSSQYDYPKEPTFFGNETQDIISEISLQWINKAAMKIVWPDGPLAQGEGVIVVTVSKQFPDLEGACLFDGRPGNEKSNSFEAVISGCMGSEETIVNLSIDNKVLELTLLKNGTTLQLQHENLHHSRTKRGKCIMAIFYVRQRNIKNVSNKFNIYYEKFTMQVMIHQSIFFSLNMLK